MLHGQGVDERKACSMPMARTVGVTGCGWTRACVCVGGGGVRHHWFLYSVWWGWAPLLCRQMSTDLPPEPPARPPTQTLTDEGDAGLRQCAAGLTQ